MKINSSLRAKIVSLYQAGNRPSKIAKIYFLPYWTIDHILKQNGVIRNQKNEQMAFITEKRCSRCGVLKPLSDFGKAQKHVKYCPVRPRCRKCETEASTIWVKNNRDTHRRIGREYAKKRRAEDPQFKLAQNLRRRVREVVKLSDTTKSASMNRLLGCSILEFKKYLESKFQEGMSWANYGPKGWHIDHNFPCAQFNLSDPEQQKMCFHHTNLQPMWASENERKGSGSKKTKSWMIY